MLYHVVSYHIISYHMPPGVNQIAVNKYIISYRNAVSSCLASH